MPGNSEALFFIFAAIFGAVDYSVVPVVVKLVESQFGESMVGLGVGILLCYHSLGAALGALIGGVMYERYDSYGPVLWLCASMCTTAAVASYCIHSQG
jgi:predicted MFS family arabinose efflux permease